MKLTRDKMALIYVGFIVADKENFFIPTLNRFIMKKWSRSGLEYIKGEAWKILKELDIENKMLFAKENQ